MPPARGVVREKNGYSTRRWSVDPSEDDWCSSSSCQRLWRNVMSLYRNGRARRRGAQLVFRFMGRVAHGDFAQRGEVRLGEEVIHGAARFFRRVNHAALDAVA